MQVTRRRTSTSDSEDALKNHGVEGLLRDKTRPSGVPPTPDDTVAQVVRLTLEEPPGEATHWTLRAMAKRVGLAPSTVQGIWKAHGLIAVVDGGSMSALPPWCSGVRKGAISAQASSSMRFVQGGLSISSLDLRNNS